MDKKTNLDDYLADLGISEDEDEAPRPAADLPEVLGRAPAPTPSPAEAPAEAPQAEVSQAEAPQDEAQQAGTQEDPALVVERFLRGLTVRLGEGLDVRVREGEDAIEAEITGERASRLAGRDGRVLSAIEVLAYTVLSKHTGRADVRVRVDAGGFRRRHADNLSKLADRLAVQVAKSGEPHELQPMPPSDRRILHIALKDHPDVMTESVGEGAGRHLVIRPRHEG